MDFFILSPGPIGQLLKDDIHLKNVVDFERIDGNVKFDLPEEEIFHSDQLHFAQLVQGIQEGSARFIKQDGQLARKKVGKLHNARWLTLCNAVLRHYASEENPSPELVRLTKFIVQVYAPAWFESVRNYSFVDGPKNLFHLVKKVKEFKEFKEEEDTGIRYMLAGQKIPAGMQVLEEFVDETQEDKRSIIQSSINQSSNVGLCTIG